MAAQQVDAAELMRRDPYALMRMLDDREVVVISTLAVRQAPLVAERIRELYIERVYRNVREAVGLLMTWQAFTSAVDALSGLGKMSREGAAQALKGIEDWQGGRGLEGFLLEHYNADTRTKERILAGLFHFYRPGTRKASVLISGMTLRKMLAGLQAAYKNLIEVREAGDARAGGEYYLNGDFMAGWLGATGKKAQRIKGRPDVFFRYRVVTFWGREAEMLDRFRGSADGAMRELSGILRLRSEEKGGKRTIESTIGSATIEAARKLSQRTEYEAFRELQDFIPAIDVETTDLVKAIMSSRERPTEEQMNAWAAGKSKT